MVQKQAKPRRGRPPRFDEDDVIAKALAVFWSHGYERTTLDELERTTGVDRSTIYNSFGGKSGLYKRAAAEYVSQGRDQLLSLLTDGTAGLADIVSFLDLFEAIQLDKAVPPGCLIVNDLAEPANDEVTDEYLSALRHALRDALGRSNGTDGTNPRHNRSREDTLVAAIIGINISYRRNPTDTAPTRMVDGLRQLTRHWAED